MSQSSYLSIYLMHIVYIYIHTHISLSHLLSSPFFSSLMHFHSQTGSTSLRLVSFSKTTFNSCLQTGYGKKVQQPPRASRSDHPLIQAACGLTATTGDIERVRSYGSLLRDMRLAYLSTSQFCKLCLLFSSNLHKSEMLRATSRALLPSQRGTSVVMSL